MKSFIAVSLFVLSASISLAQKEIRTYYDPFVQSKIKEIYFVNSKGQKNGSYKKFDSNGKMITKATFRNSFAHGKQEFWIGMKDNSECAKLPYSIKNYTNGDPSGTWYEYGCKDGKRVLMLLEKYSNGDKVYYEKYTKEGVKIEGGYTITGKQESWYANGQLANQIYLENGVFNGSFKQYYTNGQIGVDGIKKNGKWFGEKKEWYTNGEVKSIQHFTVGDDYGEIYEGEQIYYDSLGNKIKKESYSPFLNNQQKISVEIYYSSGEIQSKWTQINSGRKYQKVTYEGEYLTYHKNGQIAFGGNLNEKGNRDGIWSRYDESGKVIDELTYSDGWRVGKWKIYFNSDWEEVDTKDQATYYRIIKFDQSGKLLSDQKIMDYYINGNIQFEGGMISIEPDVLNGECTFYYPNGNIRSQGMMWNGINSGKWNDYYEDGSLELSYEFQSPNNRGYGVPKEAVRTGSWIYYKDGNIEKVEVYDQNRLIQTKSGEEAEKEFIAIKKQSLLENCAQYRDGMKDVYVERVVLGDSYIDKTSKKKIYNAYDILMTDYEARIKQSNNSQELSKTESELMALNEKMKALINEETKELEKSLKKVEDPTEIKKILGL